MAESGSGKTPTWQWVAGILLTIVLIIATASLSETRSDIRDTRKATSDVCDRVTVLETASRLQFEEMRQWRNEIKTWRDEIRMDMRSVAEQISKHERNTLSAMRVKDWNDPANRKVREDK